MNLSADALDDRSIKVVYHAAARVDTSGAWRTFVATNIDGTRRLLDSVLPNGLDRFVYISSAGVYGPKQTQRGMCADRVSPRPASYNYYGDRGSVVLRRRRCTLVDPPVRIHLRSRSSSVEHPRPSASPNGTLRRARQR